MELNLIKPKNNFSKTGKFSLLQGGKFSSMITVRSLRKEGILNDINEVLARAQ